MEFKYVFRVYPGLDAFVINGAYVPHLDVIADHEDQVEGEVKKIIPDFNDELSENCGLQGGVKPELLRRF